MSAPNRRRSKATKRAAWRQATIAELAEPEGYVVGGPFGSELTASHYTADGVPVIRGRNMNAAGRYIGGEFVRVSAETALSLKGNTARPGDIIVTQRGTMGQVSLIRDDFAEPELIVSQSQMAVRIGSPLALRDYVLCWMTGPEGQRYLHRSTIQTGLPHINLGILREMPIKLPPIDEQRRIADALAVWDHAIDTAETLVTAKRRLYEGARQRLIDDHQRNDGGDGWRSTEFGELAEELSERNRGRLGAPSVMGVLKSQGIVPMREHVMASDLDRYLVVPPGAFAYNPMRLNIGSIAQSAHSSDVLVSPDYVVFTARAGEGSPEFLRHFTGSKRWRDTMELAASGSVRLRIYFDGLAEMTLRAPSLDQQERIAMVLDAAQVEIALANKKLESLRAQKRGLMQRLLTGEWRLPANASEQAA